MTSLTLAYVIIASGLALIVFVIWHAGEDDPLWRPFAETAAHLAGGTLAVAVSVAAWRGVAAAFGWLFGAGA